jgi:uncharacterized protein YukE
MSAGNQLNVDDHAVATVIATVQQHIQTMQTDIQKVQQATSDVQAAFQSACTAPFLNNMQEWSSSVGGLITSIDNWEGAYSSGYAGIGHAADDASQVGASVGANHVYGALAGS